MKPFLENSIGRIGTLLKSTEKLLEKDRSDLSNQPNLVKQKAKCRSKYFQQGPFIREDKLQQPQI